ncbi:MAG: efflux RND transporter periplasmic adaptor subunit [Opitutales bacterium]|nr:efflux RND transporter periplasmic adaptor subunit [Opitutales bacterium]
MITSTAQGHHAGMPYFRCYGSLNGLGKDARGALVRNFRRRAAVVGALIALTVGQSACSGEPTETQPQRTAAPSLPVQAVEISSRDLSRSVQVSAPVEPMRSVRLAARTDGVLTYVGVEAGDRVRPGQLIARLDVSEQEAELARAEAREEDAELAFERLERLHAAGHVDVASRDSARAQMRIAASEAQLWRTRVGFGEVRATVDGVVLARHVEPGEAVSRHATLFELADLTTLVVRIGVSELDVRELQSGHHVDVHVDALGPEAALTGTVRRIFPAAEAGSRLVTVEVDLPDAADRGIRPDFLARARLVVDQRSDVLAVPAAALAEGDSGEFYVMLINADERLERRRVEPGVTRGGWQELRSGVVPGDRVVATNPLDLNPGARVRIVGWAG